MSDLLVMLLCTTGAGACIVVGGLIARLEHIRPNWLEREFRHGVIAFGGGVLVSAVALVLVPEGSHYANSPVLSCAAFLAGGAAFFGVERYLGLRRRETPQLSAMLMDYLPESLALGGMFATGAATAPLLAFLIGLQNLPEGFNAYRELAAVDQSGPRHTLAKMAWLVLLGPAVGLIGWCWGPDYPVALGAVMLFAAGGILYLLFQDIAPQSRLERHWGPTLGAVLGFAFGMLGQLLVEA